MLYTNNKTFWKSITSLFWKRLGLQRFLIIFINVVPNLNIPKYHDKSVDIGHNEDPIARSIEQHKNHPSIIASKIKSINK